MADVAMVTPLRDGMNLVCKEYVASKLDQTGVLILSEMAGASKELSDALIVNPNSKLQVVGAIYEALNMPLEEQKKHMSAMQDILKKFNIHHWVKLFFTRLDEVTAMRQEYATKVIDENIEKSITKGFREAKKRALFLDYDGTLVPFHADPMKVNPDEELQKLMKNLATENTRVIVISGRDRTTLQDWLGEFPIDFIGEHGVWIKMDGGEWKMSKKLDNDWKEEIRPILDIYVNKTPSSFVEEKDYSLVWHYRKVETGLGELRAREIISHLKYLSTNKNLEVLEGNKVVEIKNIEVNKGITAQKWLSTHDVDFIMAIGDDWTDEDTFKAMPEEAVTIKVGSVHSAAKYSIRDYQAARNLLKAMAKEN
jgi:trehalose 6-phosphate synthase/phosphatase